MQVDWLTVAAQIVNFLVLVWLLRRFLYRPVTEAMAKREQRIAARIESATQRETEAAKRIREFEGKSAELERGRERALEHAHEAAHEEEHRLLEAARLGVDEQRSQWLEALERERQDMREAIRRELLESAVGVARRALSDLADAELERVIVGAFLRRLERLPRERLEPFAAASSPVHVRSSFALNGEQREELRCALHTTAELAHTRDENLICGIAVMAGGIKLDWSIADYFGDLDTRLGTLLTPFAPAQS